MQVKVSLAICHFIQRIGFVVTRHNQIRTITTKLLKQKSSDAQVEPQLQKIFGEQIEAQTVKKCDDACLDISGNCFWCLGQEATYRILNLTKRCSVNKNESKKQCNKVILQEEHGTFIPLVMSSNDGFVRGCNRFHSMLEVEIAETRQRRYSMVCS